MTWTFGLCALRTQPKRMRKRQSETKSGREGKKHNLNYSKSLWLWNVFAARYANIDHHFVYIDMASCAYYSAASLSACSWK